MHYAARFEGGLIPVALDVSHKHMRRTSQICCKTIKSKGTVYDGHSDGLLVAVLDPGATCNRDSLADRIY